MSLYTVVGGGVLIPFHRIGSRSGWGATPLSILSDLVRVTDLHESVSLFLPPHVPEESGCRTDGGWWRATTRPPRGIILLQKEGEVWETLHRVRTR